MSNNIPVNGWPQLKDLEAVQPTLDRLDKIEAWKRTVKEETFTGDDITIENALALPARSLKTTINAIQDLHGYDKPWVGGAWKNKLSMTVSAIKAVNTSGTWNGNVYTRNGVAFTILTDNDENVTGIKVNGTATGSIEFLITDIIDNTFGHDKCNGSRQATPRILISYFEGTTWRGEQYQYNNSDSVIFGTDDYPNRTHIRFAIYMTANDSCDNVTVYPMVRLATETDPTFAPYSNICPISGRTAAVITRSDGDEISEDFTIQLGQTVYGADINWGTGVMTVTHKGVDMGILTWNYDAGTTRFYSGVISDIDAPSGDVVADVITEQFKVTYASGQPAREDGTIAISASGVAWVYNTGSGTDKTAFASLVDGHMMVYKLATPIELTLTPTEVQMLKGYNRVTLSDGYGTIELKALTGANWS